jgi:hypothetical protein
MPHPTVTWGDIKGWAEESRIPPEAMIRDDEGRSLREVEVRPDPYRIILRPVGIHGTLPYSWESLRDTIRAFGTHDDAVVHWLIDGGEHPVLDLSGGEGERDFDPPTFTLQKRWG